MARFFAVASVSFPKTKKTYFISSTPVGCKVIICCSKVCPLGNSWSAGCSNHDSLTIKAASSEILFQGIQNLKSGSFDLSSFKLFLEILEEFTIHPSKVFISTDPEKIEINELLGQRLNAVYQYSLDNFRKEILAIAFQVTRDDR